MSKRMMQYCFCRLSVLANETGFQLVKVVAATSIVNALHALTESINIDNRILSITDRFKITDRFNLSVTLTVNDYYLREVKLGDLSYNIVKKF